MTAEPRAVTVAIPDLAGPEALARTVAGIERHTPEAHRIELLGAGSPAAFCAPAALNRLLATTTTPYLLLLESGSLVTAGWLGRLLAPLADPATGLSGPSTNRAWNEQRLPLPGAGHAWTTADVDAYAATLAAQHDDRLVPLDTLHSLGDFCYLFRRDVAERVGGFDEAYGAGPCWEIDFSTRAARAGFGGVWVVGAYVHRSPRSADRIALERRLLAASKRLYQDRFCGRRLRGEMGDYREHCRGEACRQFAPPELIQVTLTERPGRRPGPSARRSPRPRREPRCRGLLEGSRPCTP